MPENKVQIIITTDASGAVTGFKLAEGAAGTSMKKIEADTSSFASKVKQHWLGISAAIYSTYRTVSKGIELMKLGAMADQAEESFNRLSTASSVNSIKLISDLQRASAGTIDTSNIMQKAMQAMAMGIEDPANRLPKIMEMSRIAARTMGTDVGTAFDTLTIAIAGGVRAMGPLVRAGLVTKEEFKLVNKAIEAGVDDIDTYSLALAHLTKLQAQFGDVSVDTTEIFQKLSSAWKEGAEILGQELTKAIYWFIDKYLKLLEIIAHGESFWATIFHLDKTELARTLKEIEDFRKEWIKEPGTGAKPKPGAVSAADKEIEAWGKMVKARIEAAKDAKRTGLSDAEKGAIQWLEGIKKEADEAQKLLDAREKKESEYYDYKQKLYEDIEELADKHMQQQKGRDEAEINLQLSKIDLIEEEAGISLATTQQRIKLTQDLLALQEEDLGILDKINDPAGWYAQAQAIEETRKKLLDLKLISEEYTGTFTEGLGKGFKQYSIDLETNFQQGLAIAKEITQSMENAFLNFLDSTSEGFLKFGNLAKQVLNDIMREMLRLMVVKPLTGWLMSGIGNLLPASAPVSGGLVDTNFMANAPTWPRGHSGGIFMTAGFVPSFNLPRYHNGLAPDERIGIFQTDEGILSRRGMKNLAKLNLGETGGSNLTVNVPITVDSGNKKMISELRSEIEATTIRVIRRHS